MPLFVQLMVFVGYLSFTLLFIDQSKDHIDFNMVLAISCFSTQCLLNLIACYFADRLEEDLLDLADVTYNLLWYKIAFKEREFMPWIIRRAQKTIRLSGFKTIECSMRTFMKVWNSYWFSIIVILKILFLLNSQLFRSASSYYLIFRQMSE